jgi:hypothetical protein
LECAAQIRIDGWVVFETWIKDRFHYVAPCKRTAARDRAKDGSIDDDPSYCRRVSMSSANRRKSVGTR